MIVRWRIDRRKIAARAIRGRLAGDLWRAAQFTLEEANRTIPIEEGTMARSGHVSIDEERLVAAISYGGPASAYVVRQHEDLTYRHDEGRRAKWLELTLREQARALRAYLAAAYKRATS